MNSEQIANRITDLSQKKAVKIAGFMFLFAFIAPTLNWALVLSKLNVSGNALATANNIVVNEFVFRMGITIELFMSVGLIILGMSLYVILKPINKNFAMLALLLKLVEATLMAVTVLLPYIALQVLNENSQTAVFTQEQLLLPIGLIFNSHTAITSVPMVFLGLDMMIFSYLFLKSKYIPRILAGFGILSFALILIQSLMFMLAPEYATKPINQIIFWAPSGLFEIIIGIWLLVKGISAETA
ncbi:MAG: DUF4386 domain-containing protein [Eudoraea sp.]|uniref:DUF4386 domain-containing protein n=1 Tax=Eudoraea sp. TaxID=1979955 RepID=UPI003C778219